jgi:hypothetical protein
MYLEGGGGGGITIVTVFKIQWKQKQRSSEKRMERPNLWVRVAGTGSVNLNIHYAKEKNNKKKGNK